MLSININDPSINFFSKRLSDKLFAKTFLFQNETKHKTNSKKSLTNLRLRTYSGSKTETLGLPSKS